MSETTATKIDSGETPTYIAQCPECDCLIACAVADVRNPELMAMAAQDAKRWKRDGLKVSTVKVRDVREWPREKSFTHTVDCSRDRRRGKRRSVATKSQVQEATSLLSGL